MSCLFEKKDTPAQIPPAKIAAPGSWNITAGEIQPVAATLKES
jgi:hypothetical protein